VVVATGIEEDSMSRRTAYGALFALLAALSLSVIALPALAQAQATAHTAAASVSVTATEFHFKLSKSSAAAGKVTFKVANKGHLSHDFKIAGHKTALIAAGKSATFTVTLKKGSYPYMCTVPGHAAAGMKGTFKVT
jgi:uncharacterized cupredoxin-like copper-binding protein